MQAEASVIQEENDDRVELRRWWVVAVAALVLIVAIVVVGSMLLNTDELPGDTSVDAGFARDMSFHHSQAVEMSSIVYRRTADPAIALLAYDILTTQQAQIGIMSGWLNVWELSSTGSGERMEWMGHGMGGPMPGMASKEEIASLETLPVEEMDRLFLQLMITHHKGAADMALFAATNAEEPYVRSVARSMAETQQYEVGTMEQMLAERQ